MTAGYGNQIGLNFEDPGSWEPPDEDHECGTLEEINEEIFKLENDFRAKGRTVSGRIL